MSYCHSINHITKKLETVEVGGGEIEQRGGEIKSDNARAGGGGEGESPNHLYI